MPWGKKKFLSFCDTVLANIRNCFIIIIIIFRDGIGHLEVKALATGVRTVIHVLMGTSVLMARVVTIRVPLVTTVPSAHAATTLAQGYEFIAL